MTPSFRLLRGRGIGPRLLRSIGGTTVVGVLALVSLMSWQASRTAQAEAVTSMRATAQGYANEIGGEFASILTGTRTLASTFASAKASGHVISREVGDSLVAAALRAQPDQFGSWVVFEPDAFDGADAKYAGVEYHGPAGWFAPYWVRLGGEVSKSDIYSGDSDPTGGDFYHKPRDTRQAYVSDPYVYPVNGEDVLLITFSAPLLANDAFVGVAGSDLTLTEIQARVDRIRPYETGRASLIAPNGVYAATSDSTRLGQPVAEGDTLASLVTSMAAAEVAVDEQHADDLIVRVPVLARGSDRPWALEVRVPRSTILAPVRRLQLFAALLGVVTLSLVVFLLVRAVRSIAAPLGALAQAAERVAEGDVTVDVAHTSEDEVGQVADAFRRIVGTQRALVAASERLAAGDADVEITPRGPQDALGAAMVTLRDAVRALLAETGTLIASAQGGDLKARGNASQFRGAYAELVRGINETLDATTRPVIVATEALERLAERDLTAEVTGTYRGDHARIQSAVNAAAHALSSALGEVREASERVSVAARQIASGSDALASGASEQAASLEEVSASLQESAGMTARNAEHAVDARTLVLQAREAAQEGTASMRRLDEAVRRIKDTAASTARIVRTIDEIAFQTNLLALNAAVEAARAGDAGRGFAVVADEVRALAMRSAEAARQTSSLIEESVQATEAGVVITQEVSGGLDRIADHVTTIDSMIEQISTATTDQAEGARQITTAIEQMNAVTQQTAANSEEAASAAQELASEAERLRELVDGFRIRRVKAPAGGGTKGGRGRPAGRGAGARVEDALIF